MVSIAAVVIIGRKNSPLYLNVYEAATASRTEQDLTKELHSMLYVSLDSLQERQRTSPQQIGWYGVLYVHDMYRTYGYITNTHIKIFVVVYGIVGATSEPQEKELKFRLRQLHSLFVDAVASPFYESGVDAEIEVKGVTTSIDALMQKPLPA